MLAAGTGQLDVITLLLEAGVDINHVCGTLFKFEILISGGSLSIDGS